MWDISRQLPSIAARKTVFMRTLRLVQGSMGRGDIVRVGLELRAVAPFFRRNERSG